jgi:hypothetical protein
MSISKLFSFLVLAAIVALAIFMFRTWKATAVSQAAPGEAWRQFALVIQDQPTRAPVLTVDAFGNILPPPPPPVLPQVQPTRLNVLAYLADLQTLVRTTVPLWVVRTKGPAVKFAMRETRYDLGRLGIDPGSLADYGPGLVIDEVKADGSRYLLWTD